MTIERSKPLLRLDEPPIEVKIYSDEAQEMTGVRLVSDGSFSMSVGDTQWKIGDEVSLVVHGYDEKKNRWVIVPDIAARL